MVAFKNVYRDLGILWRMEMHVYIYDAHELMLPHIVKYMLPKCISVSWVTVLEIG